MSDRKDTGTSVTNAASTSSSQRISDEALARRTGRSWQEWFDLLDAWGATERTHPEIAAWLVEEQGVDGWWAQTVTVGYEQARGMRVPGQTSDGTFSASVSKTVNVSAERAFIAFADESQRARWLPDVSLAPTTLNSPKSFRANLEDDSTRLVVWLTAKGDEKAQISLQHEKLPDADTVAEMKAYWRAKLTELKKVLEG